MNCFSWHLKSENKLDDNNEFEAYIRNGISNYNSWVIWECDATGKRYRYF